MRPSPLKHTLAVLRTTLGLTQKEMAALAGCSAPAIQAIELGKLVLSERLGLVISEKTGIALSWLMSGDPSLPPISIRGEPFTKAIFEQVQAEYAYFHSPQHSSHDGVEFDNLWAYLELVTNLQGMLLLHAYRKNNLPLAAYKSVAALEQVWKEMLPGLELPDFPPNDLQAHPWGGRLPDICLHLFSQLQQEYRQRVKVGPAGELRFKATEKSLLAFKEAIAKNDIALAKALGQYKTPAQKLADDESIKATLAKLEEGKKSPSKTSPAVGRAVDVSSTDSSTQPPGRKSAPTRRPR